MVGIGGGEIPEGSKVFLLDEIGAECAEGREGTWSVVDAVMVGAHLSFFLKKPSPI